MPKSKSLLIFLAMTGLARVLMLAIPVAAIHFGLQTTPIEPPTTTEVEELSKLSAPGLSRNEQIVLEFFQKRGITDKAALATIMGNIKAESLFLTNICEGGARVNYDQCHRGGFGLIQWTTHNRYNGLGKFVERYGGDVNSLDTQLRYLVNETQWIRIEPRMKTEGMPIVYYMDAAYDWLGWGIHGNRTHYAHDYYARLQ